MKGPKSSSEPILWSKDHANIISEFIEELKSAKTMWYLDFTKLFIVHFNSSKNGLGAALYQEIDVEIKEIIYASRNFTPAEKNYHLRSGKLKREFLALTI